MATRDGRAPGVNSSDSAGRWRSRAMQKMFLFGRGRSARRTRRWPAGRRTWESCRAAEADGSARGQRADGNDACDDLPSFAVQPLRLDQTASTRRCHRLVRRLRGWAKAPPVTERQRNASGSPPPGPRVHAPPAYRPLPHLHTDCMYVRSSSCQHHVCTTPLSECLNCYNYLRVRSAVSYVQFHPFLLCQTL